MTLQHAWATREGSGVNAAERASVWRQIRRLLAVRMDNLGDVLMTTPALAAAAASVRGIEITLLGGPAAAALAAHLPMVQHVISARVPWVRHEGDVIADDESELIQRLHLENFDAAVIFTVCTQSALPAAMICRLARIPLRLAHVRENPYDVLSDWVPEPDLDLRQARHEVQRQLDLVGHVGWHCEDDRLRFRLRQQDLDRVDALLAQQNAHGTDSPVVVVHVGASAPSRRWPAERFGMAADEISAITGAQVVFTGSLEEVPLIAMARSVMRRPSWSVAGQLSVGELAALLARARVLITNNSAPAHLAASVGTPVVDLYALTNPQHTPWRVRARVLSHDVPCRNCLKSRCPQAHHLCLRGVSHEEAVAAAIDLYRESATSDCPVSALQ
jgi:lipopolysaccharide heptosyltransferase II